MLCVADGKVHIFDLNENKNEAMCEQKVVRKAKLTKITFNPSGGKTPVLLVGDDHSCVSSLKLSPNLRWTAVTKAEAQRKAKAEAEAANTQGKPRRGAMPKKVPRCARCGRLAPATRRTHRFGSSCFGPRHWPSACLP